MMLAIAGLIPLFLGPTVFLIGTLIGILVLLFVARVVFLLAWKVVMIGAIVLLGLWVIGAIGPLRPGLGV